MAESHVGIVLQSHFCFQTVMDNIRLAKPDATQDEIENAARIAAIHDSISSFEKGYDTLVGNECNPVRQANTRVAMLAPFKGASILVLMIR